MKPNLSPSMTYAEKEALYNALVSDGYFIPQSEKPTRGEITSTISALFITPDNVKEFARVCGVDYSERMEEELLEHSAGINVSGAFKRVIWRDLVERYKKKHNLA